MYTDGTGSIWDYVVALDNPSVAVGMSTTATVYALTGNNTDVKTSYVSSGGFRQLQPVQYDGSGGQAVVGTTAKFGVASTGQTAGSLDGLYKYTITIPNFDLLTGLDPTQYALSWAMTCANDVIQGFVSTPSEITRPVPLPGALPLLVSGLLGGGAFGRWRRRNSGT